MKVLLEMLVKNCYKVVLPWVWITFRVSTFSRVFLFPFQLEFVLVIHFPFEISFFKFCLYFRPTREKTVTALIFFAQKSCNKFLSFIFRCIIAVNIRERTCNIDKKTIRIYKWLYLIWTIIKCFLVSFFTFGFEWVPTLHCTWGNMQSLA